MPETVAHRTSSDSVTIVSQNFAHTREAPAPESRRVRKRTSQSCKRVLTKTIGASGVDLFLGGLRELANFLADNNLEWVNDKQ